MSDLSRRELLAGGAGLLAVGLSVACGDDVGEGDGLCPGGADIEIIGNHRHELTVPAADVEAGVARTYTTTGSANHTHDVTLTDNDFIRLADGKSVNVVSTLSGHDHQVLINC